MSVGPPIPMISLLTTDWGVWPCPTDLIALYDKAPKAGAGCYQIVDRRTKAGKAYYAREREWVKAIDLIEASGTLRVVVVLAPKICAQLNGLAAEPPWD